MFARKVAARLKPNSLPEFTNLMSSEILPWLRTQDGFLDLITLAAPDIQRGAFASRRSGQIVVFRQGTAHNPRKSIKQHPESKPTIQCTCLPFDDCRSNRISRSKTLRAVSSCASNPASAMPHGIPATHVWQQLTLSPVCSYNASAITLPLLASDRVPAGMLTRRSSSGTVSISTP